MSIQIDRPITDQYLPNERFSVLVLFSNVHTMRYKYPRTIITVIVASEIMIRRRRQTICLLNQNKHTNDVCYIIIIIYYDN